MFHEHVKFLQARQDALLEELRQIAVDDFPKAQEEFVRASAAWGAPFILPVLSHS